MLQTSVDVSKTYGHVHLVSFIGGLLATAFDAWYSVTLVAVYVKYEPGTIQLAQLALVAAVVPKSLG